MGVDSKSLICPSGKSADLCAVARRAKAEGRNPASSSLVNGGFRFANPPYEFKQFIEAVRKAVSDETEKDASALKTVSPASSSTKRRETKHP